MPYKYGWKKLDVTVDNISADGEDCGRNITKTSRKIDLEDEDFENFKIEGQLEIDTEVLDEVLPVERKLGKTPVEAVIVARAPHSFSRFVVLRSDIDRNTDTLEFEHEFDRSDIYGRVELKPFLIRKRDADDSYNKYATSRGAKLAEGLKWTVYFDKFDGPGTDYLNIIWRPFDETEGIEAGEDALFYLQIEEEPLLYLNTDQEQVLFKNLHGNNRGKAGTVKQSIYDFITTSVFTQLFVDSVEHIQDENYEVEKDWRESVLSYFVPEMFPHYDVSEALRELKKDWEDEGRNFSRYITEAMTTVQEDEKVKSDMTQLIREVTDVDEA